MTSKLKCPFCQQELKEIYCNGICVGLACKNVDCLETKSTLGNKALWQVLIQAKQDLEQSENCCSAWETQALDYKAETIALSGKLKIATKALEDIVSDYEVDASNGWLAANAKQALKQIEHKA